MNVTGFALGLILLPAAVLGQSTSALVKASDPASLVSEMQRLGYRAELTTDNTGDPKINSATAGTEFEVFFYGCTLGKACTSIQFVAGFDTADGLDLSVANGWNREKRFGKVYLDDERDPFIEMDVTVDNGISADVFAATLRNWDNTLSGFADHINW